MEELPRQGREKFNSSAQTGVWAGGPSSRETPLLDSWTVTGANTIYLGKQKMQ